jgi:hypothetical protein
LDRITLRKNPEAIYLNLLDRVNLPCCIFCRIDGYLQKQLSP